jgi:DNA modification methylase
LREILTKLSSTIIVADVRDALKKLEPNSVRTCITSPPYWGLRDYEAEEQIGQEETPDEYVKSLVEVFSSVRDALTKDGTLWINIGDTYVGTGHKGNSRDPKNPEGRNGQVRALNNKVAGLKPKDMIGIPWRLAFALQADGWYLRSDIIWNKPNQLPSPVKDRPVSSYEHVFLLSKSKSYYYNYEAVKEDRVDGKGKRSQRDVWSINTKPYKGAHFAVYPKELILPCVLAGSEIGDTVIDPFSGSGTTGIAALENDRNYIGFESNPKYAKLSADRFKKEIIKEFRLEIK